MSGALTIEGQRNVDDLQIGDVRVWQVNQHAESVELRVIDEISYGSDSTARDSLKGQDGFPFSSSLFLESILQELMERDAVRHPVRVMGVGRISREVRKTQHSAQRSEEMVIPRRNHEVSVGCCERLVRRDKGVRFLVDGGSRPWP